MKCKDVTLSSADDTVSREDDVVEKWKQFYSVLEVGCLTCAMRGKPYILTKKVLEDVAKTCKLDVK